MKLIELKALRLALRDKLAELERIEPTCRTCMAFAHGRCEHFGATPPEEFQRQPEACEAWQYDEIPF